MSIEEAIYSHLSDSTSVSALVSTRIYHGHLPQSQTTYPVLTISLISNVHGHHLKAATGETTARIQIDCWATTMADVTTLAEAVRQQLQGFRGTLDTVEVHFIQLLDERNLSEAPADGSDAWLYRKSCDYQLHFAESIPQFS